MAVAEGGRRTFAAGYLKVTGRCASSWTVRREHQAELTMYSAIVFLVRVVSGAAVMFGHGSCWTEFMTAIRKS